MKLLCIALGGAVGALARYGVSGLAYAVAGRTAGFPWGTLAANLSGSFLIGLLFGLFEGVHVSPQIRALLLVGVLGAFTTFSTLSLETLHLLRDRQYAFAGLNLLGSCAGGLALAWAGLLLARAAAGRQKGFP